MINTVLLVLFACSSLSSAALTDNASAAITALENGLATGNSLESSHAAGQRAEELLLGGGSTVSVAAPPRKGNNFLARLSTILPGKKGPITVKEPVSYRRRALEIGTHQIMLPGMAVLFFANFFVLQQLWPMVPPGEFKNLLFAVALVAVPVSPMLLPLTLGMFVGRLIDRWKK